MFLLFLLFRNSMMITTIYYKNVLVTFIHLHEFSWLQVSTFIRRAAYYCALISSLFYIVILTIGIVLLIFLTASIMEQEANFSTVLWSFYFKSSVMTLKSTLISSLVEVTRNV